MNMRTCRSAAAGPHVLLHSAAALQFPPSPPPAAHLSHFHRRSFLTASPAPRWGRNPTKYSKQLRDVKTEYPPKRRSGIFRFDSKLAFVTDGWFYDDEQGGQVNTPILCFAKAGSHKQLYHLTERECYKLVELLPEVLREFERVEGEKEKYEQEDRESCLELPCEL